MKTIMIDNQEGKLEHQHLLYKAIAVVYVDKPDCSQNQRAAEIPAIAHNSLLL